MPASSIFSWGVRTRQSLRLPAIRRSLPLFHIMLYARIPVRRRGFAPIGNASAHSYVSTENARQMPNPWTPWTLDQHRYIIYYTSIVNLPPTPSCRAGFLTFTLLGVISAKIAPFLFCILSNTDADKKPIRPFRLNTLHANPYWNNM